MTSEVVLIFPDGTKVFAALDPVPRVGETIWWTSATWTAWTVRSVAHTAYPDRRRGKVDIILAPQEGDV